MYSTIFEELTRRANDSDQASNNSASLDMSCESASKDVKQSLCLDVCCGTGTIGICCAKAGNCDTLGVELCQSAVDNARKNAKLNGLCLVEDSTSGQSSDPQTEKTAAFICARAEAVLEALLGSRTPRGATAEVTAQLTQLHLLAKGRKLLAVVDPPREVIDIHNDILIRSTLIYVCKV